MTRPDDKTLLARRRSAWSSGELVGRLLWDLCQPLFRWSPRQMWGWRIALLRLFGARIGVGVRIHPSVAVAVPWNLSIGDGVGIGDSVSLYNLGPMIIGPTATISQGAHLCGGTHDHRRAEMPLVRASITVGAGAWICADAFVGPGVTVGDFAVVGARAVVMRDVPPHATMVGNPARSLVDTTGAAEQA